MKKSVKATLARWMALLLMAALLAGCTGESEVPSRQASSEETTQEEPVEEEPAEEEPAQEEPAEEEADAEGFQGFPEVGETINGFTLEEVREFDIMGAEIGLFKHDATGALFMYIHNDDTNRVFDITFMTRAIDNTGLPHVFEHATLGGSEKYPSRDLFFNLSYQTYQTFMNAMTYDVMTTYPVASLSEAQLLKLTDYYVDSCLHPMIMTDEEIFLEEAWRYRMEDEDAPLTLEGTVYSEMLGAMDRTSWAYINALRASFPGSTIGNVSGGDPAVIPDMTYEQLKDYHDIYYHPSNSISYLYGDVADYEAFLALLDEAFSGFEQKEFVQGEGVFADDDYEPITEPVVEEVAFAAEEGISTEHTTDVYYSFVCRDMTDEELHHVDYLLALLNMDASALSQRLMSTLPYGTFTCSLLPTGPEPLVVFMMENVEREDAETFQEIVDEALADVAENGLPEDLVDSVMATQELDNKLTRELTTGVDFVTLMAYNYAISYDPWYLFLDYEAVAQMDEWNADGKFGDAAEKFLVDSELTTLVSTYAEPGLKEEQQKALEEHLAAVKEEMSEEEIAALITRTDEEEEEATEEEEEVTDNYVEQLTAVSVEELPEEIREYEVEDETADNGVRYLSAIAGVEDVGMTQLMLDAGGIAQEDLHYLALFSQLTGHLDTTEHTRGEIETLQVRYLYNGSIVLSLQESEEGVVRPYLSASWIAGAEDLEEGYDLVNEIIFSLKLDDVQKLTEAVSALRSTLRSSINAGAYQYAAIRGLGRYDDYFGLRSYLNGLEYYAFLEETEQLLADDPDAVIGKLTEIQSALHNRTGAVSLFGGDEATRDVNRALADAFFESLDEEEITHVTYELPEVAAEEALIVESNVQYNAVFAGVEEMGLEEYSADLDVLAAIVLDRILYPELRDQYGAYSVMHEVVEDTGMYILSYRDPNVEETFLVYRGLAEKIEALELTQEELNGYILSTYSYYAMPEGELSGALSALSYVLSGRDKSEILTYMQQVKSVTPEKIREYAKLYDNMIENGSLSVTGGAGVIGSYEDMFTNILNPFGAADVSDAVFDDLSEDDPNYEYVMQAYQMGLMEPVSETTFGVDEDATAGEFALALLTLLGGAASSEDEAIEMLAGAGLLPKDTKADSPLTIALLEGLGGTGEVDWSEYIAGDVATRGELARILMEE